MRWLRQRWRTWWQSRHPRRDTHQMGQHNIYIVPTRPGLAYCLTLALLLLASINEQLSLGFALTFLLAGAGFASMHTTHANLRRLSLDLKPPPDAFAGHAVPLQVRLHNPGAARWGLGLRCQIEPRLLERSDAALAWVDVPAQAHTELHLQLTPLQRGLHELPAIHIETRFPFGLFRAWSIWRPASTVCIYPAPETPAAALPWHADQGDRADTAHSRLQAGEDVEGLRPFRRGDSPGQIAWKKSLVQNDATAQLWVRDRHAPARQQLWLDWRQTAGLEQEARLSRLCAWVQNCERAQQPYGLRLPSGIELAPACSAAHQQQCLRALAGIDTGALRHG